MMEIKQVLHKEEWDNFIKSQTNTLFVQSSNYGDFYQQLGETSWIFGIYEDGRLIGGSLVVSVHAKRGNFLFLPYGPILPTNQKEDSVGELVKVLKILAKKEGYDFIRVSPFLEKTDENLEIFSKLGFCSAPIHILAETTWLLNIKNESDENILSAMNKNHRNLVRRCIKEGVKITKQSGEQAIEIFNDLHDQTAKRHNFHRFSRSYIEKEYNVFAKNNEALVINGYLPDGQLDSSAVIMYYGNIAAYRHGASLGLDKRTPTSYLVQWEAIKEAKQRGMQIYNFWGVAPSNAGPKHPFSGITHFKKGFGGRQVDLLPCQDLPISWKYRVTWFIETLRRIKRGF